MRAALIWSAVVVVASVATGTGGYEIGLQHSRISAAVHGSAAALSGPCPSGVTAPHSSATSPAGGALLARVLPIPAADTKVTSGDQQGVLSLQDYVNLLYTSDPAEQQRLVASCFQTAVHREWTSAGGTVTSVWLVQFGTADGARSYTLAIEQGAAGDPANTDVFRVSRVADGMGYGRPKLDKFGNTLTRMIGDAGNVAILVDIFVPARTDNSLGASVLQQQGGLLTSGSS